MATSDVAFSPSVKAIQTRKGSRAGYAKMAARHDWESAITPDLAAFIGEQNSFYLATASADGQPYIQHRGGPKGFLHVLDEHTLGLADYAGNRQYISTGNLAENPKAQLFLMDYAHQRRVKIWGTARVVEPDPELVAKLGPIDDDARVEQVILFTVTAWDTNCPQHIPAKVDVADVAPIVESLQRRIGELEAQLRLRTG